MKPRSLAPLFGILFACSSHPSESASAPSPLIEIDASTDASTDAGLPDCPDASDPPATLECTGLYANIAEKELSSRARAYAPAIPLWSDNAEKLRWIDIPDGTTIDTSTPQEWKFPIGTKLWKEFSKDGKRVETRYFHKLKANYWVFSTYVWDAKATTAKRSAGGDIPFMGGTYHVPTTDECDQCHRGRTDKVLGFEAVSLGLPGASGLTLAKLAAEGLLAPVPARTELKIGDDGTAAAAPALAWLHINCGTTCHNSNSNATGYAAGMRLRLDPMLLDGRASSAFEPLTTTVMVGTNAPAWNGDLRIIPGDPEGSLLVQLISRREMSNQMPPIASSIVDTEAASAVAGWIRRMPKTK